MNERRPRVLMVEDSPDILLVNRNYLTEAGFDTAEAGTLAEARKYLEADCPEIIILDIMLPDGDGLSFLAELKSVCDAPVLICSSRSRDRDIIDGLKAGGDDYIPKPYNVEILVARAEKMWDRERQSREKQREAWAAKTSELTIECGPLTLEINAGRGYLYGEDILLKPKEFALLLYLVQNEGREITAKELYEEVWKQPACADTRALWVHISQLRKKLSLTGNSPFVIETSYGSGYRLYYNNKFFKA